MRKSMFFGSALLMAIAFTGCKSSESAYKKAYERAKAQAATVTPVSYTHLTLPTN